MKAYLEKHEVWDFLLANEEAFFHSSGDSLPADAPSPRFYSISSSQKHVGDEVHLTVAPLEYESNGHKRRGVCTHFLCELTDLHQPSSSAFYPAFPWLLSASGPSSPLIMIGPGTGVAPFPRLFAGAACASSFEGEALAFLRRKEPRLSISFTKKIGTNSANRAICASIWPFHAIRSIKSMSSTKCGKGRRVLSNGSKKGLICMFAGMPTAWQKMSKRCCRQLCRNSARKSRMRPKSISSSCGSKNAICAMSINFWSIGFCNYLSSYRLAFCSLQF